MTVEELILELKHQPSNLQVFIIQDGKKFIQHGNFTIQFYSPEYADNYVAIQIEKH